MKYHYSGKFTLHFATINTLFSLSILYQKHLFTLHFATINTFSNLNAMKNSTLFTLHFATINTELMEK